MINMTFKELIDNNRIIEALEDMGYTEPTTVQQRVIPLALEKRDIIVNSKTGSGKTAAFGIPIATSLSDGERNIKALILAPTRELALQVDKEIADICKYMDYTSTCVYGQHNMSTEINILYRGVGVVCGTPGRVLDHLKTGTMDLSELEYLVLDEADRMLDMGFIEQIQSILEFVPQKRQTMMFSATIPFDLENVCLRYMKDPETIKIESETMTVDEIKQKYYKVEVREKMTAIKKILSEHKPESVIIFCNTRWQVDRVSEYLAKGGYRARGIHGGISQSGRIKSMNNFKNGKFNILVATDVAARGIHVDDLEMVINFDIPDDYDTYVHRIGRTGRAGKKGVAISLVTSEKQYALYEIEEHIGVMIEEGKFAIKSAPHRDKKKKSNSHKLQNKKMSSPKGRKDVSSKDKSQKPRKKNNHSNQKPGNKSEGKSVKTTVNKNTDEIVFKFNNETYDIKSDKADDNKPVNGKTANVDMVEKVKEVSEEPKKKGFFARLFGR